jgi:hypothetical protein
MSDLQLGLLVIGVLVLVGVIAYNKLQEMRVRRKAQAEFGSRHEDVLLEGGERVALPQGDQPSRVRSDPSGRERAIDHTFGDRDRVDHVLGDTIVVDEITVDSVPGAASATSAPTETPQPGAPSGTGGTRVLEEVVDYIATLECSSPASGEEILAQASALPHDGQGRPIYWEGLDSGQGEWERVSPHKRYRRVRAGMQLASRAGPAAAADLDAFSAAVEQIARTLGAEPELPDAGEAARRASDLDRFCSNVDVQVGLNVMAAEGETFPGTKIRALAESAGMQYGRDGRFHRFTDGGAELFGLANLEPMPFHVETMRTLATQGVTIVLDVPRAPPAAATFRAYVEFARQAEHSLGGSLVDDNRKSINQAALDSIAMQLEALHKTMSARGITPGGPLALRLFS